MKFSVFLSLSVTCAVAWKQRGGDIDGEAAGDRSGWSVSLSADGTTLAVGAIFNAGAGSNAGHARVFAWDPVEKEWVKRGEDIDGEAAGDQSGISVSLSADGTTLAVGAWGNDGAGDRAGHARVFAWDPVEKEWVKRGEDIDGEAAGDWSGWSMSLSADGTALAVGAFNNDGGPGSDAGHARVFAWDPVEKKWKQRGGNIDGEAAGDKSGYSVSLSADGTTLAVGAPNNGGTGLYAGRTRVYATCAATEYISDNECTACPSGHTCDGTEAKQCDRGKYSSSGASECIGCEAGTYQDATGQSSCALADAGFFVDAMGASEQVACDAGKYSSSGASECIGCEAGTYQDATGQSSCALADAGFFVDAMGASEQVACDAGKYSGSGASECIGCEAGTYISDNACLPCPSDSTCDGAKATACAATEYVRNNACVEKKYATAVLRAACLANPNSWDTPGNGCASCCPECVAGQCECFEDVVSGRPIDLGDGDDCALIDGESNIIKGMGGDDAIVVKGNENVLNGHAGNDALSVVGDSNELDGGADEDTLIAKGDLNRLRGGAGVDDLTVTGDDNGLWGNDGDDRLTVEEGDLNILHGDANNDKLTVKLGHGNTLYGDADDDTLSVEAGDSNELFGGYGLDALTAKGDRNSLTGGPGRDYLVALGAENSLFGNSGDDILVVAGDGNTLNGNGRDDTLTVRYGDDNFLHGGAGKDKLVVHYGEGNTLHGDSGHDTFFVHGHETRDSVHNNRVRQSAVGLIVGLCVGAAVLLLVLAVVVCKLRGRAAEETSMLQLDTEVQLEA